MLAIGSTSFAGVGSAADGTARRLIDKRKVGALAAMLEIDERVRLPVIVSSLRRGRPLPNGVLCPNTDQELHC